MFCLAQYPSYHPSAVVCLKWNFLRLLFSLREPARKREREREEGRGERKTGKKREKERDREI